MNGVNKIAVIKKGADGRRLKMNKSARSNRVQPRYLTVSELSNYIGLTVPAIYHLAARRKLQPKRLGRRLLFDLQEVDAALTQTDPGRNPTTDQC